MVQAPHEEPTMKPVYPGLCRPSEQTPAAQIREGRELSLPRAGDGDDTVRGRQPRAAVLPTPARDFGDFLVWRKDGLPSYQLACVVDDAAMAITEVVRGRDLLKSTARQLLLQRALGLPSPAYFHTELLVDSNGVRLAKRHDALALRTLRKQGLTPDAVLRMISASTMR